MDPFLNFCATFLSLERLEKDLKQGLSNPLSFIFIMADLTAMDQSAGSYSSYYENR